MKPSWVLLSGVLFLAIALALCGPAVRGTASLSPEGLLDCDLLIRPPGRQATVRPFGDGTPVWLDLGREHAVAEGFRQGRLDLWNPWNGAGCPSWAEQGGPFFPTKVLFYLFPSHEGLMAALAARLVVAALGMLFLAHALGLAPVGATMAGALFECSGILTAELAFSNTGATYVLPWALWGAHALTAAPGPRAVGLAGLALGVAALGGHPTLIYLVYLAFGVWLLGDWHHAWPARDRLRRLFGLAVGAVVLAVAVGAFGVLPFLDYLAQGFSYKQAADAELYWAGRLFWTREPFPAALFLPGLVSGIRDTIPAVYWPFAPGASIGFTALLLAMTGLPGLLRHGGPCLLAIFALAATWMPYGLHWLHFLPGMRYVLPWYCFPLLVVPLCLAAGFGLQALGTSFRRGLMLGGAAVAFGGALICLAALDPKFLDFSGAPNALAAHLRFPGAFPMTWVSLGAGSAAVLLYLL